MVEHRVVISCEHGGNTIPKPYRALFASQAGLLTTHRAFDPGALACARRLAARFDAPLFAATTSRLLVDLNRSPGHPRLFSNITRDLPAAERRRIVDRYHSPHRNRVQQAVQTAHDTGATVVHIACHSFTPVLDGRARIMDAGLLYDPRREGERLFCAVWKKALQAACPACRVRRNAPYKGISDGLPTALRRRFHCRYIGIELELNHRSYFEDKAFWRRLCDAVNVSLAATLKARAGFLESI
ncbi:N-formylglutamate amidohydrolase [Desulfatitalea alkaliphila]|uniref:N-formylglutamate amidohydrolase n=1 Tax=Desulfatitalea alkaliphila TaxID=2929485 RepID=A0AA41ULQ5_9BACT|nr:N-formylglutamate amidohydrolase [Desulfatitalea alkaliphila]MCJ8502647.1 N-formylglutamate amidohydrolase [Desulfatitalea alkaliphila]